MIKDLWKKSHFFCKTHPENPLQLTETGFYVCPVCGCRFSSGDVYTVFQKITNIYSQNDKEGIVGKITGETVNINKRVFCTVADEHYDGSLDLCFWDRTQNR